MRYINLLTYLQHVADFPRQGMGNKVILGRLNTEWVTWRCVYSRFGSWTYSGNI